ncbi:hypothetical protein E4T39_00645 [Aureobasidium subglaciale]|nr:hypothetical protein E4T39_00645 [Aureobasidium subglaciale]
MFRSLTSKNSASSSKRKKTDQSTRRTESVASSSTHRKDRPSRHEQKKSTADGLSGLSTHRTTIDRLDQLEPRSLTEEAIRSLGLHEDGRADINSYGQDLSSRRALPYRNDDLKSSRQEYIGEQGQKHYSAPSDMIVVDEQYSHGSYPQGAFGTSSRVQDQFPGQDPSSYARSAFDPSSAQVFADTYTAGGQGQFQKHFAATPVTSSSRDGVGAAAEYYSQTSMQTHQTENHHDLPHVLHEVAARPGAPTGPSTSNGSLYHDQLAGHSSTYPTENISDQAYTYQQHRPAEAGLQGQSASYNAYHQHSHPTPSTTILTDQALDAFLPGSLGQGKQATKEDLPYQVAAASRVTGGYGPHPYKTHQYNTFAPTNNPNGGILHDCPSPRPNTPGHMATQHRHKGPISKFVDWWKDYEDVRKMEEYTEYIGVCKYCFDPRSSAIDAPRKHYRGGRYSSESLRRRSSDSLRRPYSGGSRIGRVDKDQRYHSSDSERRTKKSSWLGASIAAYGLSKVGRSLWQSSRDFDDTYSIRSGRRDDVSKNSGRRKMGRNHSHDEMLDMKAYRAVTQGKPARLTAPRSSTGHPHQSSLGSRHSQTGRHNVAQSDFLTTEAPSYNKERIHVRHPSPDYEHTTTHSGVRRGHDARSRSQSPSLGQVLGLKSATKRKSVAAPTSSSSRQDKVFTGVSARQASKTSPAKSKRKGFFSFANSSSSSANSDLAFGMNPAKNGDSIRRATATGSDEHLKATLLGIGATAAALSAVHRSRYGSKKEFKTTRKGYRNSSRRSKQPGNDEEGWESATNDDSDSISSGLAFGDFDASAKLPRRRLSSDSIISQSSGTDKWSWRWRRKSDKKNHTNGTSPGYRDESFSEQEPSIAASQPLKHVQPTPIASPAQSDVRGPSSMPGAFPEHSYAIENTSIQQPRPVLPLNAKLFDAEVSARPAKIDQSDSRVPTRPYVSTGLRRTQSSPVSNHAIRDVALAGLAGAATSGILSIAKDRLRDNSPSNVRFELTEKQAKKEERQQRKVDAKESKERAREEKRDNKERARLDRERALQEESRRLEYDFERRQVEEAKAAEAREEAVDHQREGALREESNRLERDYARRKAEQVEALDARELEADRQREEEIKEFMRNALAEQAREAEQKERREVWQAQQTNFHNDSPRDRGNEHTDITYATRPYEPSNEHSGQPLMDDDLIDPEFFTRRRSHSDLARHEELARKAAAKVVADLEQRYKNPTPSQAEFFAPKELFEPSGGKTKVRGPVDDTDYHIYHMSGIQDTTVPTEPPPPYQYTSLRDDKDTSAWNIPQLNVIAPTPPTSYAGSAKDDKSPISASRRTLREASQEFEADMELQKSSKVSWGEDQTRFYDITTPESSQEHVVLPSNVAQETSELRHEHPPYAGVVQPDDGKDVTQQLYHNDDLAGDTIEQIVREIPITAPKRFYQQPFVESVSDVAFTLNSPGTEGAPPVQGFVEGEIAYTSEPEHMPHIPGGFDDPDLESETQYRNGSSKIDHDFYHVVGKSQQVAEQPNDDYRMTKKERKKRDKAARRASSNFDRRLSADEHGGSTPSLETDNDQGEHDAVPKGYDLPSSHQSKYNREEIESATRYSEAAALVGAAAVVGTIMHRDRARSPNRRKSEPEDFDRERPQSSHSEPRDVSSQSTPTSPVYERRPSLPDHAFDDLDILASSKRPKKSKRNSLLNYPAVGSPLRSAMTWDEHIEPIAATQSPELVDPQLYEPSSNVEQPTGETKTLVRGELPSPESEHGAESIVSAPVGEEDGDRRRKSRKSREQSTSPRRSASVAASEPQESSRKHKRRSHRDSKDLDDASSTTSARSRTSYSSKRDRDDEDNKTKKKGGILSLFRRKTSDDMASDEQKRSKNHRRRHSSEYTIGEVEEDSRSIPRSRSRAGTGADDISSRHSSSSRHRGQHDRNGSVDDDDARSQVSNLSRHRKHRSRDTSRSPEKEGDETPSVFSESRRKHRHRSGDDVPDHERSQSRVGRTLSDQDQSFLVDRVEDEEPMPLPDHDVPSSSKAPESSAGLQKYVLPTDSYSEVLLDPTDVPLPESEDVELQSPFDAPAHGDMESTPSPVVEAQMSPPTTGVLSPFLEQMTPARPIVPLRITSSTAVPLRFRRPPTSPSLPRERSVSFSSSLAHSPSSPITPKPKRPLSTEFNHSTEFRPLYLLERTRKPQNTETEQNLPSLPPSRSASSSSLQTSEDWQSAAEDFDPSEHDNSSPPIFDQTYNDERADVMGSTQTTPKATEFPRNVLEPHTYAAPEYYSWSDMEYEERLRQEAEKRIVEDPTERLNSVDADDFQDKAASADEFVKLHTAPEVVINQDPMATDIWGELSDDEQLRADASDHNAIETIIEPEENEIDQSRTASAKKRKNKRLAKLGTSSVQGIGEPVRETPAELARRREQDAQDAVETWLTPSVKPQQASAASADVARPSESTASIDEKKPGLSTTPEQGIEPAKQDIEMSSPLLSRKKSKKGKKKQKSVILDQSNSVPTEDISEIQIDFAPTDQSLHGIKETQCIPLLEEEPGNDGLTTTSPVEAKVGPLETSSVERLDDISPVKESDYFLSKAERRMKSKKAKKVALSIAIPVVAAAAMLAESEEKSVEQENIPKSTVVEGVDDECHAQQPAEDKTSFLTASYDGALGPDEIARSSQEHSLSTMSGLGIEKSEESATEPVVASHSDEKTSLTPGSSAPKLLPDQDTLLRNAEAEHGDPTGDLSPTPEISQEDAYLAQGPVRDVQPTVSQNSLPEAASTSKRSSWFSWLPGGRSHEADEPKVLEDHATEPDALPQEPFERLLEHPVQRHELFDDPIAVSEGPNVNSTKHDETSMDQEMLPDARAKPEEHSSIEHEILADNTVHTKGSASDLEHDLPYDLPKAKMLRLEAAMEEPDTLHVNEVAADPMSKAVVESLEMHASTSQSDKPAVSSSHEPETAADLWTTPSKKAKQSKKDKKAKKNAMSSVTASSFVTEVAEKPRNLDSSTAENRQTFTSSDNIHVEKSELPIYGGVQPSSVDATKYIPDDQATAMGAEECAAERIEPPSSATAANTIRETPTGVSGGVQEAAPVSSEAVNTSSDQRAPETVENISDWTTQPESTSYVDSTTTAEEVWAMPLSKKKKKKGKKGKQPVAESPEDMSNIENSGTRPFEETPQAELTSTTPEVFETPAEGSSSQYFETPAEPIHEQHFVVPIEESLEPRFASVSDKATPSTLHREESTVQLSPLLQSKNHLAESSHENVQTEPTVEGISPTDRIRERESATQYGSQETFVPSQNDVAVPLQIDAVQEIFREDLEPVKAECTAQIMPEAQSEPSTEISTMDDRIPAVSELAPTNDAIENAESQGDVLMTESNPDPHFAPAITDPDLTYPASEYSSPQDTIESDNAIFNTISSKKSKKDKKKAKKANQRGHDPEPFKDEIIEPVSTTADEQPVERQTEAGSQEFVKFENDVAMSEAEPMIEDQPTIGQSSKKDKRRAKKTSVAESPFEQTLMDDEATESFPDMAKQNTSQGSEQVELPHESIEPIGAFRESAGADQPHSQMDREQILSVGPEPEQPTTSNAESLLNIEKPEAITIKSEKADRDVNQDLSPSMHGSFIAEEPELNEAHVESQPQQTDEAHCQSEYGQTSPPAAAPLTADSSHAPQPEDQVVLLQSTRPEPPSVEDQAPSVLEQLILEEELAEDSNIILDVDQEFLKEKAAAEIVDQTIASDEHSPTANVSFDPQQKEEPVEATESREKVADLTEERMTKDESGVEHAFAPAKLSKKEKRKVKKSRQIDEASEEVFGTLDSSSPSEKPFEQIFEDGGLAPTTIDPDFTAPSKESDSQAAFGEAEPFTAKLSKQARKKAKKSKRKDNSIEIEPDDQIVSLQEEDTEDIVVSKLNPRRESATETTQLLDHEVVHQSTLGIEDVPDVQFSSNVAKGVMSELAPEAQRPIGSGEQAENSDQPTESSGLTSPMRLPDTPSFEPNPAEVTNDLPLHVTEATPEVDIEKDKSSGLEAMGSNEQVETREVPILEDIVTPRGGDSSGTAPISTGTRTIDGEPIVQNIVPEAAEENNDFFTPITNSKKNKKEKKAKSRGQTIESTLDDGGVLQGPQNDWVESRLEPITATQEMQDEIVPTIVENVAKDAVEEVPLIVGAEEWTLPIKQSKKDKRKAKKLEKFEEPLPASEVTEEPPHDIETMREPISDFTLPSEVVDIMHEPSKPATGLTLNAEDQEPVADLDINDDWNFARKPSKKEKRKAKKALLNDEQQEIIPVSDAVGDVVVTSEASFSTDRQVVADESVETKSALPVTTVEKAVPAVIEDMIQDTIEDTPVVVVADELVVPLKRSKKENRRAKKLKVFEEPLSNQEATDRPAALEEVFDNTLEHSGPAADPDMAVEDPGRVTDSEVNDDWSFSHMPSKKEKRKAKKILLSDEQQHTPPAPKAPGDNIVDSEALPPTSNMTNLASELTGQRRPWSHTTTDLPAVKDNPTTLAAATADRDVALANATEPVVTPIEDDQRPRDIDFAATLAAGLQDAGFDPKLVIDDPIFHRRASPTSVGEADPGEIISTTTRRPKSNSGSSKAASPTPEFVEEVPMPESFGAAEVAASDDFSDALTAGLVASGFAPDAFSRSPIGTEKMQEEPDAFSFAIPKRKKKGKKSRGTEPITMEMSASNVTIDAPKTEEREHRSESITTSPKRLANPSFFHTSEVSQSLPVRIDHSIQSDGASRNPSIQTSANALTGGPKINDEPIPTLRDSYAALHVEPETRPFTVLTHDQPPTWSFDNLPAPYVQKALDLGQGPMKDDPFVPSPFVEQWNEGIARDEPVSPVESTTKDRTSHLFQSPADLTHSVKAKDEHQEVAQKQTRFHEVEIIAKSPSAVEAKMSPTPQPSSQSGAPNIGTHPAPLGPSPSERPATPSVPLPLHTEPDQSPPLTRKKSIYDLGSPGPGHSVKAARRSATPQQSFRDLPQSETFQAMDRDHLNDHVPTLRPKSSGSNHSAASTRQQLRSPSSVSNHSAAPSLRRINRSLSGDLRAASRRRGDSAHGPQTTITIEPPPTPPLQDEELNGHGASRASDMANVYEGWGDVRSSPVVSPTRPPSMRKRQSMHILDLEAKLDQLASENRYLQDAVDQSIPAHLSSGDDVNLQDMLKTRDMQLQDKDAEIQQIRVLLESLQREIAKLTDVNNNLSEANRSFTANNDIHYATLQNEHANAHKQLQQTSQELEGLKNQHHELSDNIEDTVRQEIANALEGKNAEIRKLREELDVATQQIRLLQSEILASQGDNYLTTRDEDYFDTSCQKLCQHVQQWVLRFSKFSDNRMCRLTSDLTDDKIAARLDNAILDGSDVDKLLGDRIRRRDVFMSVVMTMIWEYVFTRYLFGMDREQRQKLKALEKILSETGPPRAVAQWRAITLTLLSRRPAFATQRNLDTEAVAQEIFGVLSALLPPPAQLEVQILSSLRNVLRLAVELSIEMRSQKAEYIMLPPLQPEYDTHGDLVRKVHFNAALMNERSGDYNSNDELERSQAVVKIVLFPLVVKKGDDIGEGEDEIVVCPAQVLVAGSKQGKKVVRVLSGAMDIDNPRTSNHSIISGLESGNMI